MLASLSIRVSGANSFEPSAAFNIGWWKINISEDVVKGMRKYKVFQLT